MGKPHILFVYQYLTLGGVEVVIHSRLKELQKLGISARALFFHDLGGRSLFSELQEKTFICEKADEQIAVLRDFAPDFVIAFDTPRIVSVFKEAEPSIKIIYEFHTIYPRNFRPLRDKQLLANCEAIFVPSEHQKRVVQGIYSGRLPIMVVPNPIREIFFQHPDRLGGSVDRPIVAWVGRIDERKNWRACLSIAARINRENPRVDFWMVGGARTVPEMQQRLWAAISRRGLVERIRWFPAVPHHDMPGFFKYVAESGGCLLSTSRTESFGVAVLEAMACGCPVIVPAVGALVDLVQDGETGLIYPRHSYSRAAQLVLQLIHDPCKAREISKRGKQVAQTYSPRETTQRFLDCLSSVGLPSAPYGPAVNINKWDEPDSSVDLKFEQAVRNHFHVRGEHKGGSDEIGNRAEIWISYALETNARGRELIHRLHPYLSARWGDVYAWAHRRALDVGCAYGGTLKALAGFGAEAVGVEVDEDLLALARINLGDDADAAIRLVKGKIEAMDAARLGEFDLIVCDNVLEHVDDPQLTVAVLADLLKHGGVIYIAVPNPFSPPQIRSDPHFGLFGITLLDRLDATRYFSEARRSWTYQVGRYASLDDYYRWIDSNGLRPGFIDLDTCIPNGSGRRHLRIRQLAAEVQELQSRLAETLRDESLSAKTREALGAAIQGYGRRFASDLQRIEVGVSSGEEEMFLQWYAPLVWHVLAHERLDDDTAMCPRTIRTVAGA
jgi:glycosyltransferase involved in cell wall biosynthesis/SAM-dependent methyltransferase